MFAFGFPSLSLFAPLFDFLLVFFFRSLSLGFLFASCAIPITGSAEKNGNIHSRKRSACNPINVLINGERTTTPPPPPRAGEISCDGKDGSVRTMPHQAMPHAERWMRDMKREIDAWMVSIFLTGFPSIFSRHHLLPIFYSKTLFYLELNFHFIGTYRKIGATIEMHSCNILCIYAGRLQSLWTRLLVLSRRR